VTSHWDVTTQKNICRHFEKSTNIIKFRKVLKRKVY
jgi:hypothetical protein